jgi:hypothetical protein
MLSVAHSVSPLPNTDMPAFAQRATSLCSRTDREAMTLARRADALDRVRTVVERERRQAASQACRLQLPSRIARLQAGLNGARR